MLRDRLEVNTQANSTTRRLSFLESSLRILPAHTQRFGDDRIGASNATPNRDSRKGGCAASRSMPLKERLIRDPN